MDGSIKYPSGFEVEGRLQNPFFLRVLFIKGIIYPLMGFYNFFYHYMYLLIFRFFTSTYDPKPDGPGPLIIWKSQSQICCRTICEMFTASEACIGFSNDKLWSWNMLNVEYSSNVLMVRDHITFKHMVKDPILV